MKYMSIRDFIELGYLQEVNRQLLHPLGLALEVTQEDDGAARLSGVWDCRDDLEGIVFGNVDPFKADHVETEEVRRRPAREAVLGYWVQPLEPPDIP